MGSAELKIPPPLVALVFGLVMWLVSLLGGAVDVSFVNRIGVAIVVASIGVAFGFSAMASFVRAKTTMNPTKPSATSSLITHGVYRLTRNPMYLSLVLYLVAWAVYLSNWLAVLLVPVFALYIDRFQIKPEERALSALYGSEYASYKSRVRRWL
jgi:protein-S-isoprenylcysteine O-methyltransferase Ste14